MEKLPLKVLCQLLAVHTKRGMRKLQVLLANLAQPSCMRVALDALMMTIPDEFARPARWTGDGDGITIAAEVDGCDDDAYEVGWEVACANEVVGGEGCGGGTGPM